MKAIVIGSGIAGLAVSVRMALKGFKVEVYESNNYAGGKLSEINLGSYRFDAGPSLFTMPQYFEELFNLAGKSFQEYCPYKKLDIISKYFYPNGKTINAYKDVKRLANEIEFKLGVSSELVEKHLQSSAQLFELTNNIFLQKSLHKISHHSLKDLLKVGIHFRKLKLLDKMHSVNEKRFKQKEVVQFFDRFATYNGSNPYDAPATLNVIPHLEHNVGAFFPINGMYSITESLLKLSKELGVKVFFNQKVERILVEKQKTIGIQLRDGTIKKSEIIISNVDITPTYQKLLRDHPEPKKILSQPRSSSALIFYWGIKKSFKPIHLHNIFFSKDYKKEFDYIFKKKDVFNDPTVYVNCSSKLKPNDAPKNCENWFVMINTPNNSGQDWKEIINRSRKNILEKLSQQLNVNISSLIEAEAILDPISLENKTNSFKGALYGNSSNSKMAAFWRHPNFHPSIDNLYFCGGSVHPGGGIPLCMLSAKIVDNLINIKKLN